MHKLKKKIGHSKFDHGKSYPDTYIYFYIILERMSRAFVKLFSETVGILGILLKDGQNSELCLFPSLIIENDSFIYDFTLWLLKL